MIYHDSADSPNLHRNHRMILLLNLHCLNTLKYIVSAFWNQSENIFFSEQEQDLEWLPSLPAKVSDNVILDQPFMHT